MEDGIFEFENALTENECERLIEYHNDNPEKQKPGMIEGGNIKKDTKDTTDVYITDDSAYERSTRFLVHRRCEEFTQKYIERLQKLGIDRGSKQTQSILSSYYLGQAFYTNPQIQRVDVDGQFNWHADFSPLEPRLLHFIFYLNDPESCTGGKTEFSNGRIIEPKRGKLLIFPCSPLLVHRGNVVKKGVKYICSVFLQCDQKR